MDNNNENISEKKSILSSRLKRKFRFGTNAVALIALAIVLFVVVNLVLENFSTQLTVDLTEEKLFTIGEITKEKLSSLNKEVEIVALYDEVGGETDSNKAAIMKVLAQYNKYKNVTVTYADPDSNPGLIKELVGEVNASGYSEGDYIVKCGEKTRKISESEMFSTSSTTGNSYYSYEYVSGMQAEKKITSAIIGVTSDNAPVIYYMTGHGEESKAQFATLFTYIEALGCEINEYNFADNGVIPADAAVLIFMGPKYDLSGNEKTVLRQWIEQKQGQLVVAIDPDQSGAAFPNFNEILSDIYGLRINADLLQSLDSNRTLATKSDNSWFAGISVSNGPLANSNVYDDVAVFNSRSVDVLSVSETYLSKYELIKTTARTRRTDISSGEYEDGIFYSAAAAASSYYGDLTHAAVFGSTSGFTDKNFASFGKYTARTMSIFAMSVDWMIENYEENEGAEIKIKNYSTNYVSVSTSQGNMLGIVAILVIPVVIIGIGVVIWLRRRHL